MSGKSFLRGIKKVAQLATNPLTIQLIGGLVPGGGTALTGALAIGQKVMASVTSIEARHMGDGQENTGQEKLALAIADFEDYVEAHNALLEPSGKMLQADTEKIKKAVELQVAAFNAFADLKESLKLVDIPKK